MKTLDPTSWCNMETTVKRNYSVKGPTTTTTKKKNPKKPACKSLQRRHTSRMNTKGRGERGTLKDRKMYRGCFPVRRG